MDEKRGAVGQHLTVGVMQRGGHVDLPVVDRSDRGAEQRDGVLQATDGGRERMSDGDPFAGRSSWWVHAYLEDRFSVVDREVGSESLNAFQSRRGEHQPADWAVGMTHGRVGVR